MSTGDEYTMFNTFIVGSLLMPLLHIATSACIIASVPSSQLSPIFGASMSLLVIFNCLINCISFILLCALSHAFGFGEYRLRSKRRMSLNFVGGVSNVRVNATCHL